jgi:hypothetical protein
MKATFRGKNRLLLSEAVATLRREQPMTLRQLFYQLVSAGRLSNSQKEYKRLGGVMTRLREAGDVPFAWLVDHVRATLKPSSWSGLADFGDTVRQAYRKDLWAQMPCHIEVFVEKDAIAGTIQPVTREYDVALQVCRGYASLSFVGEIAAQWSEIEKAVHAYYLGDYDPSGFDIERDLREKLSRYSGRSFEWSRLAVSEADFDLHDLIALPVKNTDKRARAFHTQHGNRCAEVDALPPTELRHRVRQAIESHIEPTRWARLQEVERLERETLGGLVGMWTRKGNLGSFSDDGEGGEE